MGEFFTYSYYTVWCELRIEQIDESQSKPSELKIEVNHEVMQSHFGSQASMKTREVMRPVFAEAEPVQEFIVNGLGNLLQAAEQLSPRCRPSFSLAARWG